MTPERWRQIEDIFNAALEREFPERPAFLENACHGDKALRRRVEALLQQDDQHGELLSQPIDKVVDEVLAGGSSEVGFSPGSMAGPYRIGERLGVGGMGEVYRAQDTRLNRTVAIKTLKSRFTERFEREARAVSALNHPHICTLYDIGSQDGIGYLVMEYVKGEPLKGPLRIAVALELAIQIAGALAAAHEKGILHRDLKPANILVSKSGVKLLDFGLAKFVPAEPRSAEVTVTAALTGTGQMLGTLPYMAPEQIEGKSADARSDIFAFGLVLYEMLTGRRAFQASSQTGLMASILKEEPPPLTTLLPTIPSALERTVCKCLAKEPERRWQTASDLRDELAWIAECESSAPRATAPVRAKSLRLVWPMIGIAALAAGVTLLAVKGRQSDTVPTYRLRQITRGDGINTTPALSPDGTLLAYASDRGGENNVDIWVQQVAGGDPIRITRHLADESRPQFSPDGSQIVFSRQTGGLYVVPSLGGTERQIASNGLSAAYSPDGKWLAYCTGFSGSRELFGLYLQATAGGAPRKLETGLAAFDVPIWSPDSQNILLTGSATASYAIRGFTNEWYVVPAAGGKAVKIGGWENAEQAGISEASPRAWLKNGNVLFSANHGGVRNIWQMRLEKETWILRGTPQRVTAGAGEYPGIPSLDGRIPYATGSGNMSIYSMAIDPRQGKTSGGLVPVVHDGSNVVFPTLTRDGTRMVYVSDRSGNEDIWIKDLQSGAEVPVVATPARERRGIISPDGSQLAFLRVERGGQVPYLWPLPAGPERVLCERCGAMLNFSMLNWSPDGKSVLIAEGDPQRLEALDVSSGNRTLLARHEKYPIHDGNLSPDGRWLAFKLVTSASMQPVYVTAVGTGTPAREKDWIKISGDYYQTKPFWSPDGDLLYYFSTQDSFDCLYARRLDSVTKRPLADAFAVRHFHEDLRPPAGSFTGYGLAADRLYLTLATGRSNVWLAEPEKR